MFRLKIHLLLAVVFILGSCSGSQTTSNSGDSSNLVVDVAISNDNSGVVVISATADNATEFHFYVNDGFTSDPFISQTGSHTHTYASTGTYIIEIRAYGSSGRYVRKTRQIAVVAGDPVNVGEGYSTPLVYEGMTLIWNDEFEGTSLNANNWSYDNGDGCPNLCGWGNNELEYYRPENSWVSNGVFTIEARKEDFQGSAYTSTKIVSRDKQSFRYGRIDIRALLPKGQGLWPALWLLGSNHASVGWPECGEIDIMEMIGGSGRENTVSGNVYWDDGGKVNQPSSTTLNSGTFNDEYHVFTLLWDETQIEWLVNDESYKTFDITHESRNEFHKEFFFIMNVAIGGNWPGSPNATTIFPTQMHVDYIRVFQEN